jgi:hypothetical protein
MGDEAIIPDGNQFADERVGLDATALPDHDPLLDLDEGTNERIVSDLTLIKVRRLHHRDTDTELDVANLALEYAGGSHWVR